jgi:hypothetical protein
MSGRFPHIWLDLWTASNASVNFVIWGVSGSGGDVFDGSSPAEPAVAFHKVALWPGRRRSTHNERVASMPGQHITTSARHGLPLTAILGLLLTGTEVQRWR